MTDLYDVNALQVIEEQAESQVRRQEVDGVMYFSIVDVINVLIEDLASPRKYWTDMRRRIQSEGFVEVAAKCRQLKLVAADGKKRVTDCADTEVLLRIMQSIPSRKAEGVKRWLAGLGAREIAQATRVPGRLTLPVPADNAPLREWATYFRSMAQMYERALALEATVVDHEIQIAELQARADKADDGMRTMLERIGPATISPQRMATVKSLTKRLSDQTGAEWRNIYWSLTQHFRVSKVEQLPAERWDEIVEWFKSQLKPEPGLWGE